MAPSPNVSEATDSEKRKLNSGRNELRRIMEYHTVSGTMTTKKLIGTNAVYTGTTDQHKKSFVNVNIQVGFAPKFADYLYSAVF